MSLSKVAQNCDICKIDSGIYSCPRCNRKYCSSRCYKSPEHELCSESFYREWVETSLRSRSFDDEERRKMVSILKKCNAEFPGDTSEESAVAEQLASQNIGDVSEELSFTDRFAGLNIDNADEEILWQNLSKKEKADFKLFIEDDKNLEEIIQLKQPWWTVTMLNLVSEVDDDKPCVKDDISPRPHFPLNVKKLSCLTSKEPSSCLQYNIINILYAYAFLYRFYNCDLKDFLEDVVNIFFILSPVLSEGKNYHSLEESVQDSIRLILNSDLNIPLGFAKSIVNDVNSILQGPNNAKPATFVLCALHDIEILLLEAKALLGNQKNVDKSSRKRLMPAVKKIEYFMSWSLDFENSFSGLASDLLLLMLPEIFIEPENSKPEVHSQECIKKKPLIEEIE